MSVRSRSFSLVLTAAAMLGSLSSGGVHAHVVECARSDTGGGEWPQFGLDLAGSHNQTGEHLIDAVAAATLTPAWTFDANFWSKTSNNEITGYPVVSGGCVYVGSSTGVFAPVGWVFSINADTGELVWRTQVNGGVYSTVAVSGGVVYAFVSRVGTPFVAALDQETGKILWERIVDHQVGSDAVSSPVVYDGMVWVGVSGTAAEINEGDRASFQGSFVLIDASPLCAGSTTDLTCTTPTPLATGGSQLAKTYTIPPALWPDGYSGGSIWSTIAIDAPTRSGYVGTGNPFNYDSEHENTNAVLKIDLDRTHAEFGRIVGSYKGSVEEYFPELANTAPCKDLEDAPTFALGLECARLDLDFGAQPNIWRDGDGAVRVGIGQKSGVYHVIDGATMQGVWKMLLGHPSAVGGIVGSAAFDGATIYGPHTIGGYLWAIQRSNPTLRWVAPVADAVHWGPPVTLANHVLYTVDLKGFLDAYDSGSGLPLLHRPIWLGADTHGDPTFSWGGATVAHGMVFASVGIGLTSASLPSMPNGFVVAYRPLQRPAL
jgi:polyvinyl alcohol dehydrogenase (cytochrome)